MSSSNKYEQFTNTTLADDFQKTLDLYDELAHTSLSTNNMQFQKKVQDGITRLENMTRNVNILSLFSTNETIEEISTENLKYLLIPAFLADFSLRNQQYDRLDMLEHAEIYFKDYIQRLNDYGVCDIELKKNDLEQNSKNETALGRIKKDPMISSAIFRDSKINRYKEAKKIEEKLASLKRLICEQENKGHIIEEEVERNFYLTLITQWLGRAVDEISSIELEKPMAKIRASMLAAEKKDPNAVCSGGPNTRSHSKPLKPLIITRDSVQKKVYGIGYPSIPTVTVDEFISQKVADGSLAFNDKRVYSNSLYDWADNPDKKKQTDIDDEERKEQLIEKDDPQNLARQRRWDAWKDDHRRGEGNRHNMG